MSKIFHEAPGRRVDYKTVTNATEKDYLMQFVTRSWVENVVAKKARLISTIWSIILEAVSYWQQYPKVNRLG